MKTSARKPRVAAAPPPSHRTLDVAGILTLAGALVVLVALITPNSGLFGSLLGGLFTTLFGRGAWAVPPLLMLLGMAILRGRGLALTHLGAGLGLLFVALLGALARDRAGDFFDPTLIAGSGGYVGAILGWALASLFGAGKAIGLAALGMVGLVLCVDIPLRELAAKAPRPKLPPRPVRAPRPVAVEKLKPIPAQGSISGTNPVPVQSEEGRLKSVRKPRTPAPSPAYDPFDDVEPRTVVPEPVTLSPATVSPTTVAAPPPKAETKVETPKKGAKKGEEEAALDPEIAEPKEGYALPPIALLQEAPPGASRDASDTQRQIETLQGTLEQFGISGRVVEVAAGPTITRYEVNLGPGVKVSRITALADNIAMDMAASQVRVEAPIPGKSAIGVEVPNLVPSMVSLRELCDEPTFRNHPSRLIVALGRDVSGQARYADLTKMPHLLIGGATNSGKSIGLATLITSLLMRNTPKDVRLVMIDPKRVELTLFDRIPHLMCPVIKDVKEAAGVLRAVWREMDRRYDLFSEHGCRNIDGWNAQASFQDRMPYIVVVIDELADLMLQCGAEVETVIVRLAQLARAVGIHMVIATQRPSVDVITGLIKANIPSRIAFSVASYIDSRTILDMKGAEALIGKGDMLYKPIDAMKPVRVQGCYVSEKEIGLICRHWREQQAPEYTIEPIEAEGSVGDARKEGGDFGEETDPLWEDAVRWAVDRGQASTSMLQRKFSIGFQRASRLLDMMEERQIVGPRDGPRPRDVLLNPLEVDALFNGGQVGPKYDVGPTIGDGLDEE